MAAAKSGVVRPKPRVLDNYECHPFGIIYVVNFLSSFLSVGKIFSGNIVIWFYGKESSSRQIQTAISMIFQGHKTNGSCADSC